jgi:hypothetical protein
MVPAPQASVSVEEPLALRERDRGESVATKRRPRPVEHRPKRPFVGSLLETVCDSLTPTLPRRVEG